MDGSGEDNVIALQTPLFNGLKPEQEEAITRGFESSETIEVDVGAGRTILPGPKAWRRQEGKIHNTFDAGTASLKSSSQERQQQAEARRIAMREKSLAKARAGQQAVLDRQVQLALLQEQEHLSGREARRSASMISAAQRRVGVSGGSRHAALAVPQDTSADQDQNAPALQVSLEETKDVNHAVRMMPGRPGLCSRREKNGRDANPRLAVGNHPPEEGARESPCQSVKRSTAAVERRVQFGSSDLDALPDPGSRTNLTPAADSSSIGNEQPFDAPSVSAAAEGGESSSKVGGGVPGSSSESLPQTSLRWWELLMKQRRSRSFLQAPFGRHLASRATSRTRSPRFAASPLQGGYGAEDEQTSEAMAAQVGLPTAALVRNFLKLGISSLGARLPENAEKVSSAPENGDAENDGLGEGSRGPVRSDLVRDRTPERPGTPVTPPAVVMIGALSPPSRRPRLPLPPPASSSVTAGRDVINADGLWSGPSGGARPDVAADGRPSTMSGSLVGFEDLSDLLMEPQTVRLTQALLIRLEDRLVLFRSHYRSDPAAGAGVEASSFSPERAASEGALAAPPSSSPSTGAKRRSPKKKTTTKRDSNAFRFSARVLLAAYMVTRHPRVVFNTVGEKEERLLQHAFDMVLCFERLLVRVLATTEPLPSREGRAAANRQLELKLNERDPASPSPRFAAVEATGTSTPADGPTRLGREIPIPGATTGSRDESPDRRTTRMQPPDLSTLALLASPVSASLTSEATAARMARRQRHRDQGHNQEVVIAGDHTSNDIFGNCDSNNSKSSSGNDHGYDVAHRSSESPAYPESDGPADETHTPPKCTPSQIASFAIDVSPSSSSASSSPREGPSSPQREATNAECQTRPHSYGVHATSLLSALLRRSSDTEGAVEEKATEPPGDGALATSSAAAAASSEEASPSLPLGRCLELFDEQWQAFQDLFQAWRLEDARSLEAELARAAAALLSSLWRACRGDPKSEQGRARIRERPDLQDLEDAVNHDLRLLRTRVAKLGGARGLHRLELVLLEAAQRAKAELQGIGAPPLSDVLSTAMADDDDEPPVDGNNGSSNRRTRQQGQQEQQQQSNGSSGSEASGSKEGNSSQPTTSAGTAGVVSQISSFKSLPKRVPGSPSSSSSSSSPASSPKKGFCGAGGDITRRRGRGKRALSPSPAAAAGDADPAGLSPAKVKVKVCIEVVEAGDHSAASQSPLKQSPSRTSQVARALELCRLSSGPVEGGKWSSPGGDPVCDSPALPRRGDDLSVATPEKVKVKVRFSLAAPPAPLLSSEPAVRSEGEEVRAGEIRATSTSSSLAPAALLRARDNDPMVLDLPPSPSPSPSPAAGSGSGSRSGSEYKKPRPFLAKGFFGKGKGSSASVSRSSQRANVPGPALACAAGSSSSPAAVKAGTGTAGNNPDDKTAANVTADALTATATAGVRGDSHEDETSGRLDPARANDDGYRTATAKEQEQFHNMQLVLDALHNRSHSLSSEDARLGWARAVASLKRPVAADAKHPGGGGMPLSSVEEELEAMGEGLDAVSQDVLASVQTRRAKAITEVAFWDAAASRLGGALKDTLQRAIANRTADIHDPKTSSTPAGPQKPLTMTERIEKMKRAMAAASQERNNSNGGPDGTAASPATVAGQDDEPGATPFRTAIVASGVADMIAELVRDAASLSPAFSRVYGTADSEELSRLELDLVAQRTQRSYGSSPSASTWDLYPGSADVTNPARLPLRAAAGVFQNLLETLRTYSSLLLTHHRRQQELLEALLKQQPVQLSSRPANEQGPSAAGAFDRSSGAASEDSSESEAGVTMPSSDSVATAYQEMEVVLGTALKELLGFPAEFNETENGGGSEALTSSLPVPFSTPHISPVPISSTPIERLGWRLVRALRLLRAHLRLLKLRQANMMMQALISSLGDGGAVAYLQDTFQDLQRIMQAPPPKPAAAVAETARQAPVGGPSSVVTSAFSAMEVETPVASTPGTTGNVEVQPDTLSSSASPDERDEDMLPDDAAGGERNVCEVASVPRSFSQEIIISAAETRAERRVATSGLSAAAGEDAKKSSNNIRTVPRYTAAWLDASSGQMDGFSGVVLRTLRQAKPDFDLEAAVAAERRRRAATTPLADSAVVASIAMRSGFSRDRGLRMPRAPAPQDEEPLFIYIKNKDLPQRQADGEGPLVEEVGTNGAGDSATSATIQDDQEGQMPDDTNVATSLPPGHDDPFAPLTTELSSSNHADAESSAATRTPSDPSPFSSSCNDTDASKMRSSPSPANPGATASPNTTAAAAPFSPAEDARGPSLTPSPAPASDEADARPSSASTAGAASPSSAGLVPSPWPSIRLEVPVSVGSWRWKVRCGLCALVSLLKTPSHQAAAETQVAIPETLTWDAERIYDLQNSFQKLLVLTSALLLVEQYRAAPTRSMVASSSAEGDNGNNNLPSAPPPAWGMEQRLTARRRLLVVLSDPGMSRRALVSELARLAGVPLDDLAAEDKIGRTFVGLLDPRGRVFQSVSTALATALAMATTLGTDSFSLHSYRQQQQQQQQEEEEEKLDRLTSSASLPGSTRCPAVTTDPSNPMSRSLPSSPPRDVMQAVLARAGAHRLLDDVLELADKLLSLAAVHEAVFEPIYATHAAAQ